MNKCLKTIINAVFPANIKCIFCNEELNSFNKFCTCNKCLNNLPFNNDKICEYCGEHISSEANYCLSCKKSVKRHFTMARSSFDFREQIVDIIHCLKYDNGKYLAPYLSEFLIDEFKKQNWIVDVVIPIPLNEARIKQRGYNQSEIISKKFETDLNIPLNTTCLQRKINTPTQTNLSKKERLINLKDAFEVTDKEAVKNKNILLIDDVFTTGATMEEASKILLKSKANKVYCLTLAHVINPLSVEKE